MLYYGDKVVVGVYDKRLLVKPTMSAVAIMPNAPREIPYDGAKQMLLVENIENKDFLSRLFEAVSEKLPEAKKKK